MKIIIIDIIELNKAKHEYLKEIFSFNNSYGNNLDALYDCLTDLNEVDISFINKENINDYSSRIIETFKKAALENNKLKIRD